MATPLVGCTTGFPLGLGDATSRRRDARRARRPSGWLSRRTALAASPLQYAASAEERGLRVLIAGAGGAAHLPGMAASKTTLPVLGVPVESKALSGWSAALDRAERPRVSRSDARDRPRRRRPSSPAPTRRSPND